MQAADRPGLDTPQRRGGRQFVRHGLLRTAPAQQGGERHPPRFAAPDGDLRRKAVAGLGYGRVAEPGLRQVPADFPQDGWQRSRGGVAEDSDPFGVPGRVDVGDGPGLRVFTCPPARHVQEHITEDVGRGGMRFPCGGAWDVHADLDQRGSAVGDYDTTQSVGHGRVHCRPGPGETIHIG